MIRRSLFALLCLLLWVNTAHGAKKDALLDRIEHLKTPLEQVKALNKEAELCWQTGDYKKGMLYAQKGLAIARKHKLKKYEGRLLNNIGIIYDCQGDYPKSLKHYFEALRIQEKIHDLDGQAYSMSNIGLIYTNQGNNDEALYYHNKSLAIRKRIKSKSGIAASYNNIGMCYLNTKEYVKGLYYFKLSEKMDLETKDSVGYMDDLNNIGICYMKTNRIERALDMFNTCLELRRRFNDKFGESKALSNIGTCYSILKQYDEAEAAFMESLEIGKKIGGKENIWYCYENLSEICYDKKDYKRAYDYMKRALRVKEEWNSASSIRDEAETELSYQFEKKSEIEKVRQMKKDIENQERRKQSVMLIWFMVAIVLTVGSSAFILFRRWKVATEQKRIIEEQRAVVEEKNNEIVDSINYAQRIQSAILPSAPALKNTFKSYALFYQAKDIVAGDFYWMHQVEDTVYFAVADCTGHGVPGAFMSLLCNNALNRAILEGGAVKPGEILTQARNFIVTEFAKSHTNLNDGMDISFCAWNPKQNTLTWSGANNPLWIIHPNSTELVEIKGDKQPVGNHHLNSDFTTRNVTVSQGSRIYLFTDGIADQFGGAAGKKFKSKQLKELLLETRTLEIDRQVQTVGERVNRWKGNLEQIDDICLLAVEF